MTSVFDLDVDIDFGKNEVEDWRKSVPSEEDPDDEELEKTPADVVAVLGFDPLGSENKEDKE